MDFSTSYLGKPLTDLAFEDIVSFFSRAQQETETIEFKSFSGRATFDSGLQTVIKGISAFLNSSGGILIWGAPVGSKPEGKSEEVFQGALSPVKELIEKDRLINKISSAIVPLPVGVSVQTVSLGTDYVYIFEIQPSQYKPHQHNSVYYVRLDGQSRPAPHYLVEALMKRVSYPDIRGVIKFRELQRPNEGEQLLHLTVAMFNFSHYQNEETVSFRLLCDGGIFRASRSNLRDRFSYTYPGIGTELLFENFSPVLHFGTPKVHDEIIIIQSRIITLALSFGGKYSPAKTSYYVLDLRDRSVTNANELIVSLNENVLISDLQKTINTNSDETLKAFLGR